MFTINALVINRFSSDKCFTDRSEICSKLFFVNDTSAIVSNDLAHSMAVALDEVIIEIFGDSRW